MAHQLMCRIMSYDHSVDRKDIIKFIYYFMILFLSLYVIKYFLLLVPYSHQGSAIMLSFVIWLSFAWIGFNMWIYTNINYFEIS
jgi:hypothetical protein